MMKEYKVKSLGLNMILNIIRQGSAIIFPLITFPYIARILGNGNYGIFNYSQSIISYFFLIAGLGITSYAVREGSKIRNTDEIRNFCVEIFSINIYSTIFAYLLLVITLIGCITGDYSIYILIMSLGIVATTIGADWINMIYEDYLYLTLRYIIIQILSIISIFLFVRDKNDLFVYICIYTFASYGGFFFNIFYVRKYIKLKFSFKINFRHIKPLLILFFNAVTVVIYVNSDVTILKFCCSDEEIGTYSFASRIYAAAKQIINAFVIVTLPRVSAIIECDKTKYYELMKKILSVLMLITFPIVIFIYFESEKIIYCLGGEQYLAGKKILKILSIAIIFAIISSYISNNIVLVNRLEKYSLIATFISAGINIILNFILIPKLGIVAAALTTLIAEATNFMVHFCYSTPFFNYKKMIILRDYVGCFFGTILVYIECFAFNMIFKNMSSSMYTFIQLVILVGIAGLTYVLMLFATKNSIVVAFYKKIHKKTGRELGND